MPIRVGTRFGAYEVTGSLGVGGMGEVYRARDINLKRDVALKTLPPAVANDADRLARFQREAEVLASLNHPNIAQIYGLERSEGTTALAMELIEGPTLEDRIAEGPLPVEEALRIATQITDALEAAHERGVVHRDVKPANITLRPDGIVKVLDFGIAKALDTRATTGPGPAALTTPAMTEVGMILGTAAYMSPEQARGRPVDRRTDIWAFGCVLFEMLTGRRAFEGRDTLETLGAVLTNDPEWSALPAELPPPVRALVMRCLDRDLRKRIGDIAAARFVLNDIDLLAASTVRAAQPTRSGRRLGRPAIWAIALATLAIPLGFVVYRDVTAIPEKAFTYAIVPPDGTTFVSVAHAGPLALSPDGSRIAFVAEGAAGRSIWVQSINALDARPVAGTEGATAPFWSPSGAWLGFQVGLDLKKVGVAGGQPQTIARANFTSTGVFGGTWNRDDTILFYGGPYNTLASVSASGGEAAQATERHIEEFDENHIAPAFLPDDRHYLLLVRGGRDLSYQLFVGELGSNERRALIRDVTNARYAPPHAGTPGYLVYARDRKLIAHRFDTDTLMLSGTATVIADDLAVSGTGGIADFTLSSNGVLAYRRVAIAREELAWYDRKGDQLETFGDRPVNPRTSVRVSTDGKWAAFTRTTDGTEDVWIADLERGGASRFTLEGGRSPIWSPDGAQLAFLRGDTVYRKPFSGSGAEVAIWQGPGILSLNDWSGDGKWIVFSRWDTAKPGVTGRGLWLLPDVLSETASHEPSLFESMVNHGQFGPRIGPPRWISFDGGSTLAGIQVFVRTMPGEVPGKWQVSVDGGNTSRWRGDAGELYFVHQGTQLFVVDIDGSRSFQASKPRALFTASAFETATTQYAPGWDVTPDGQRFVTTVPVPDKSAPTITVVMNWQSTLAK